MRCRKKQHVLLLRCGSDGNADSLRNTLASDDLNCTNFDVLDGPQFDLADDINFDQLMYDVAAGEYAACFARPDMSSFSRHRSKTGNVPYRKVEGGDRYGCR